MVLKRPAIDLSDDNIQEPAKFLPYRIRNTAKGPSCDVNSDSLELKGSPRVLNINRLDKNNIVSFAKEHDLADLILTLINLAEGPEGFSACTREESDEYKYDSNLRVPANLVYSMADEDICYVLKRRGNNITIKIGVCMADKYLQSHKDCHKRCAPCPDLLDFGMGRFGDADSNWRLRACQLDLVTLIDSTQEIFEALCYASAHVVVEMILRFRDAHKEVTKELESKLCVEGRDMTRDRLWVEKQIPGAPAKKRKRTTPDTV